MAGEVRLDEAMQRFESALKQFETVVATADERRGEANAVKSEAETLRADRKRLENELELVKVKAFELVDTSNKAVGKIDAAMSRIRAVIHSNSGG